MTGDLPAFDAGRLRALLPAENLPPHLAVLPEVGSTNEVLRALAARGAAAGTVVIADHQSAGRGRMGRDWYSARCLGLYVSVLFRPERPASELTRWTLAAAVAACEASRQAGARAAIIKWPNDILWQGKKLGGILAESRSRADGAVDLVLGTGLNVGQDVGDFPGELSSQATSLRLASGGSEVEREALAALYLQELAGLAGFLNRGRWEVVAEHWERLAPGARGTLVRVDAGPPGGASFLGLTDGLEPDGAMRVRRDGGGLETVRLAGSITPLEVR